MEDLIIANDPVYVQHRHDTVKKEEFARLWENSISGEDFVKQAHEHIEELYAARNDA